MRPVRGLLVGVVAGAIALTPARADEGDAAGGDRGEVELAVVVTGADGVKLPGVRRATVQVSMERALKRDRRLIVVDKDDRLAARAGRLPADVVAEARALVSSGEELLRRGQAEAALLKLQGASTQLARVLAWTQKQELARAQFLLGAAQVLTGDAKAAQATFVALLAWRPEMVADADIEPTKVLPVWEKARKQAARLAGGSIEIETAPAGALAYVDGKLIGFTPTVVEGLAVGVHYVTLRRDGHERRVEPVKVSGAHPVRVDLPLSRSPRADEVATAERQLIGGLGEKLAPASAQEGFAMFGELLGVEHVVAVVVEPGDGRYRAYVYDTGGGLLGEQAVVVGDRELEDAFAEAATSLYVQVARAKARVAVKPRKPPPSSSSSGRSVFRRWWFWAGVGTVIAAGVGVPLLLSIDRDEPLTCPAGSSCGDVVFRF
ncbi:MAG TPA: PEGA domain-containing protein [Kofleriaceae bacterium]|nr:PEGA domain-containing protein [Kofleriaceae bacterium]